MKITKKYYYLAVLLAVFLFSGCAAFKIKQRIKTDYSKYSTVKFYFLEQKNKPDENAQKLLDAIAEEFVDYIRRFGIHWRDLSKSKSEKADVFIGVKFIKIKEPSSGGRLLSVLVFSAGWVASVDSSQYIINLKIYDARRARTTGEVALITKAYPTRERSIEDMAMQFAGFLTDGSDNTKYEISKDDEQKYFTEEVAENEE